MKISLAGPSYTSRSVTAAAQQTMNLYPEVIEPGNEGSKIVLYGRPGLSYFCNVSPAKIRAMWAGGGRLFVVHGSFETEVHQDGTTHDWSSSLATGGAASPDPAQIFSNGHQLMIVSGGQVYCDNGTGAQPAKFAISGHGDTVASTGTLKRSAPPEGGPPFNSAWTGQPIMVDDVWYTIAGVPNVDTIVLDDGTSYHYGAPDATNVIWMVEGGTNVDGVTGAFLDGYFIVNRVPAPGTPDDPGRQFAISALNDGTMWQSLDFGVKEGHSDYIRSILADHEELWLFGTETTEIWTNTGGSTLNPFPFERQPGAFIHVGSVATYAPCSVGLSVCWLGQIDGQPVAYRATGLQPSRISTHAVEQRWTAGGYRVDDAVSFQYTEDGHIFWCINFWQQAETWVYDLTTGMWHERAGWDGVSTYLRHKAWFHAFIPEWGTNGRHVVGDPVTGKLYFQSLDNYTDDTAAIQYTRAMPHLVNEDQWGYHHRLELYLESGAQAGGDPLPVIGLDWSDDRGHTFINQRFATAAASGDYRKRAVWRRLGKSRDRVYRVGVTAKSKVALVDAFLEMTPGFA